MHRFPGIGPTITEIHRMGYQFNILDLSPGEVLLHLLTQIARGILPVTRHQRQDIQHGRCHFRIEFIEIQVFNILQFLIRDASQRCPGPVYPVAVGSLVLEGNGHHELLAKALVQPSVIDSLDG